MTPELSYLFSLERSGIHPGLSTISSICKLLGNPQENIKTIHIGGTNGKGSTASMIASILTQAGYKTSLYTSPHLQKVTERIKIKDLPIPEKRFLEYVKIIKKLVEKHNIGPTFFEFLTAMAFLYFAEEEVDVAIIETGMGGILDATNIITPLVSVITNVDYDHTEYLGTSLKEICIEKCGIIKQAIPVITGETKEEIKKLIEDQAEKFKAPIFSIYRDFSFLPVKLASRGSIFTYRGIHRSTFNVTSPLPGLHQCINASLAIAVCEILNTKGFHMEQQHYQRGIEYTTWPGRLEWIDTIPPVLLDGAHNQRGIIILRNFIEDILRKENPEARIIPIFGVLKDKDAEDMIKELSSSVSPVIITAPRTERALPVDVLERKIKKYISSCAISYNIQDALSKAFSMAGDSDVILITGSLYLVGEAKEALLTRTKNKNHF